MHRKARILSLALLLACSLILSGASALAAQSSTASPGPKQAAESADRDVPEQSEEEESEQPAETTEPADSEEPADNQEPAEPEPLPQPQLSPQMTALRDAVRAARARIASYGLNSRDSTPGRVMELCLAFGVDASVGHGGSSGKRVNALGYLCWNYPCAGYRLLRAGDGHVMGRVGYGLQNRPSQFLAVLAQARVPAEYEIRVDDSQATVADLVEFEKLSCRSGTDLSQTLIGLAHYLDDEQSWENDLGEPWSLERLVREEMERSVSTSSPDVTARLMGLSFAVDRQSKEEEPLEGALLEADKHIRKFHDFALGVQNPDGTWHPSFFAYRGTIRDATSALRSTGHILEWLVFSLPEERLQDARVVRSVAYVTQLLGSKRSRWNVTSMSDQDLASLMRAVHALSIYDHRMFQAPAAEESAAEDEAAAEEDEQVAYRSTPE